MKSFRNLPRVRVLPASSAGVADVIGARSLVVSQAALQTLEALGADVARGSADPSAPAGEAGEVAR